MIAPPYIKVSGRVEVQVSVLTGLGAIGNYNQHATAKVVVNDKLYEVPVMTGNALKHWHSVYLAEVYEALGGDKLNELCKRGIGLRGYKVGTHYTKPTEADNECEAIEDVCNDIHGFLVAKERPFKRDSLFKASFLTPVLTEDNVKIASKFAIQHNRVVPSQIEIKKGKGKKEEEETAMMIFKQEYATAPYGFSMSANLGFTLQPLYDAQCSLNLDDKGIANERALRIKAAIIALINLITGSGSRQSRALPIVRLRELIVAISNIPIPNLVHGSYPDYVKESIDIMNAYATVFDRENVEISVMCYGAKCSEVKCDGETNIGVNPDQEKKRVKLTIEYCENLQQLVEKLVSKAIGYISQQHAKK